MTIPPRWLLAAATATFSLVPFTTAAQSGSTNTSADVPPNASSTFRNVLLPQPARVTPVSGTLPLTVNFTVSVQGVKSPRLNAAVLRAMRRLEDRTGLELPRELTPASLNAQLKISVDAEGATAASDPLQSDESYTLTVTRIGAGIDAPTVPGALHALETLLQLVQPDSTGSKFVLPEVTIQDSPRFRWRGLMIDCSRHFEPMDVLKRNIDAMAAVKLNVFHWHLTDDQGFRIESKVYPKLTQLGSDGLFYTQADARELVRYAETRGIRVVPEFEMPGHSAAWLFAYPELGSGTKVEGIRREFGISDTAIDPTREATYLFIDRLLTEMTGIFPDPYVHIGGDETPAPDWKSNPKILTFMKLHDLKDNDALQAYFNSRVNKILTRLHKRMVGWDEILNPALPKDVVIQSWRGEASLAKGAAEGYQGVLSAPYYLDAMKPAGVHYLADPVPADTKLTLDQQKLILGGEMTMWAEQVDQRSIDSRIWPRAAAIAERFWSPQGVRDVDSMYRRLDVVSLELETLGLRHLALRDAALRALAQTEQPDGIDALRNFSRALEPVSFSDRYEEQHTSQLTPLTNFVDAVRPDPPSRHRLEMDTRTFLSAPHGNAPEILAARQAVTAFYQRAASSVPEVRQLMATQPRLAQITTRAQQMPALAQAGLEAVSYLTSGTSAPAQWKEHNLALIEAAKKPSAVVRFTFLDSLSALIQAVPETK